MNSYKQERKANKKQKRYKHMLLRETKLEASNAPTRFLMLGNSGLVNGLKHETLLELFLPYGQIDNVVMLPGKSFCFVEFRDETCASNAYDALHGKVKVVSAVEPGYMYLIYTNGVPNVDNEWGVNVKPPGLIVLNDFVTKTEEEALLACVDWQDCDNRQLRHRRVTHYGYEFRYDINNVDKASPLARGLPKECSCLFDRLRERGVTMEMEIPNQLTVNQYETGQGIPPHVDTHSAFDDPIMSLSLGAEVIMEFKHPDGRSVSVLLPERSLLIMSGESRYAWSHGITPRKFDIVPTPDGSLTVQKRGLRTSFTFRHVRQGECDCSYQDQCDSHQRLLRDNASRVRDDDDANVTAERLEEIHVHRVYEEIASHFSETRHKPWPNVLDFVKELACGDLLVDVGCGNGKYFGSSHGIYELGCDRSEGLATVCRERGFQVFNCNCLALPLRSNVADRCISIAVIHHLASKERRLQALQEIVRVLRPAGRALVYVWAKDQQRHKTKSTYLKQDRKNRRTQVDESIPDESVPDTPTEVSLSSLPVHTNRTQFQHQDVLVPWKVKPSGKPKVEADVPTFLRYYHVFDEGELEEMCSLIVNARAVKSYYDQGNWCVVLEKYIPPVDDKSYLL